MLPFHAPLLRHDAGRTRQPALTSAKPLAQLHHHWPFFIFRRHARSAATVYWPVLAVPVHSTATEYHASVCNPEARASRAERRRAWRRLPSRMRRRHSKMRGLITVLPSIGASEPGSKASDVALVAKPAAEMKRPQ